MKVDLEQWQENDRQRRDLALRWWNSPIKRGQAEFHGRCDSSTFRAYSSRKVRAAHMKETVEKVEGIPEDAFNVLIRVEVYGEPIDFSDKEGALGAIEIGTKEAKRMKIRKPDFHQGRSYDLPRVTLVTYDQPLPKTVVAPAYINGGCCCDGDTAVICIDENGKTIAVLQGRGYSHEAASGGTSGMRFDSGTEYSVPEGTAAVVYYSADTINGGRRKAQYLFGDRTVANKAIDAYMASGSLWWEKGQIPAETLLVEEKV